MLNLELKEEIKTRQNELHELQTRRLILVNELNEIAQKVEYGPDDYDAGLYWDDTFHAIAQTAGIGYDSHRPGKLYTFWVPSADNC